MAKSQHVNTHDGTRIAYDVTGDGPALMLLHGAGKTRQDWHKLGYVERLKGDFKDEFVKQYVLGVDLHVAVWPGGVHNTQATTRSLAKEGRSYVLAASGLMRREDIPPGILQQDAILSGSPEVLANGGSCLAGPDCEWLIEPVVVREALCLATTDHKRVREKRQNFDPAGHYSRPDVTRLTVDRRRQSTLELED